eukprot:Hpha_TRINITY_DN14554_c0_g2::TRINITY_DN14554_c0_g2_i1::g.46447::m.46447
MGCGGSTGKGEPDKTSQGKRSEGGSNGCAVPPFNQSKASSPPPPGGGGAGEGEPGLKTQVLMQGGPVPGLAITVDGSESSDPFNFRQQSNGDLNGGSSPHLDAGGGLTKSKSMIRLEAARQRRHPGGDPFEGLGSVLEGDMSARKNSRRVSTIQRRTSMAAGRGAPRRRMSSIMGDFSASLAAFLESKNKGEVTTAEGQLKALYDLLETRGGQGVRCDSLKDGFSKMGFEMSEQWVAKMFTLADGDASGSIDWDEFQAFFKSLTNDKGDLDMTGERDEGSLMSSHRRIEGAAGTYHRQYPPGKRPIKNHSVRVYVGHKARVKCVSVAPTLHVFASCDREEAEMHLFDLSTGKEMRSYRGHQDTIMCVTISPDKKHMATASRDANLIIWDVAVGHAIREFEHPGVITCCAFATDGKHIYTGCQDNVVRKYSVSKGRLIRLADRLPAAEKGVIVSVAVQPGMGNESKYVALSRSRDNNLLIVDAHTFRLIHNLQGHQAMIWACTFSPEGAHVVSNCEKAVRVWDVTSGRCVNHWGIEDKRLIKDGEGIGGDRRGARFVIWTTCTYCPTNFSHFVAAVSSNNVVFFLHHLTGEVALAIGTHAPVYCMGSGRDEDVLSCGDEDGNLYVVELF